MSYELHQEPQVESSAQAQLELKIGQARRDMKNPHELIEHVIGLYGAEFVKANDRIAALDASLKASGELLAEQKRANDELFKIKQRVVIANRSLMQRNKELEDRDKARAAIVTAAVAFCDAHSEDFKLMSSSDSMDVDTSFMILCQLIEKIRVKAEDTPA